MAAGGCDSDTCGVTDAFFSFFTAIVGCIVSMSTGTLEPGTHVYDC